MYKYDGQVYNRLQNCTISGLNSCYMGLKNNGARTGCIALKNLSCLLYFIILLKINYDEILY